MYDYELKNYKGVNLIAGFDEAGRGCCAGPLVVAAVILPANFKHRLIKDSKELNEKQREKAYEIITEVALEYTTYVVDANVVDELNPKQASKFGMKRCLGQLYLVPRILITDYEKIEDTFIEQINLVKGDRLSINVAAASIVAKVTRDRIMNKLHEQYPEYNWKQNKGYCTKEHEEAMEKYGVCEQHRRTYKNVAKYLK
ncbi:ribonuclease HII [Mycoplasmopsis caviae]|uniref:Ribonuclease HII n=1 Tax=Mycoplasmopsis caviae TaxID=55603 RepID=A0A3P8LHY2_9BACT|nr:ribonuclease HII [Mycoplasmopsis caviae]UUD35422.1 ribonuclease HII [Mycoplasmopsis caviae]VDR41802.1 ribonuclease H [Mycoplasmopsis caviae]